MPPAEFLASPSLRAVLAALPNARIAGGAVRDALAGHPVADIDLATPEPPDAVIAALRAARIRPIPTGLAHGTVTAVLGGASFEITTLRRDVETDGRHALVEFTDDWREDAARRDFTINAMSMDRDGRVFDYFGGIADLAAGRVRFVGDAATRIAEDYLRILRFFRFHARYGRGEPDAAAVAAIAAAAPHLARLSPERIWSELKRILAAPAPAAAVYLMEALGVLAVALPGGVDPAALGRLLAHGAPPDPLLRFAALSTGDADTAAAALRLSGAERDTLIALRDAPALGHDADAPAIRVALADWPCDALTGRAWLAHGDAVAIARIEATEPPVFPLRGRDLAAAGVAAGPAMGALLREIRTWWLAGGCIADAAACGAELARRLGEASVA
ncbi:MAG: CCA tRNA nucleotidyltransferase [Alphaproteobacteria bacterium]|nr:CCA tRNA nucleotidyltransferase [Alphaproteobacteria bacterium]